MLLQLLAITSITDLRHFGYLRDKGLPAQRSPNRPLQHTTDHSLTLIASTLAPTQKAMPVSLLHSTSGPVLHCFPLQLHTRCRNSLPSYRKQSSSAQAVNHIKRAYIKRAYDSQSSPSQNHAAWRCKARSSRAAAITAAATEDKGIKVGFLGLGIMGTAMVWQHGFLAIFDPHTTEVQNSVRGALCLWIVGM